MAGWISSKLKVAENFLHQIDQQAAESLGGKNERPQSPGLSNNDDGIPKKIDPLPLKIQLTKKLPERNQPSHDRPHHHSPTLSDSERNLQEKALNASAAWPSSLTSNPNPSAASNPSAGDGDWTELLSSPTLISPVDYPTGLAPQPKSEEKINRKSFSRPVRNAGLVPGNENVKRLSLPGDEAATSSESRRSGGEPILSGVSRRSPDLSELVQRNPVLGSRGDNNVCTSDGNINLVSEPNEDTSGKPSLEIYHKDVVRGAGLEDDSHLQGGDTTGGRTTINLTEQADGDVGETRTVEERGRSSVVGSSDPHDLSISSSSVSIGRSDSETDSASSSDSENESERRIERRKRRERILTEKAAAMAIAAIKERENVVAKLEGEKQSLEKILEERQKQQAQEASELQTSMMETMEAVDLEKQKHNSTRMEALARLAKLETINAELARSLATTQWNLEAEVNRVSELRQQIDLKELAVEELGRRMSKIHHSSPSLNQTEALKRAEYEQEILEAEYSFVCEKIGKLKEKARKIEENIEMTRMEIVHPTEVEAELEKRLEQLTDHLIQKQAQVEALSSEKATLLFRIETVFRLLDENRLSQQSAGLPINLGLGSAGPSLRIDVESGTLEPSHPLSPLLHDRIQQGKRHLGSFFLQLDAIFSAGAMFIRRNQMAQLWSLVYLLCLHLWVMYILMSHSHASDGASSGAVFSLETINKTSDS